MASQRLEASERAGLLDAIHAAILRSDPAAGRIGPHELLPDEQLATIDRHLEEMIDIVRQTKAARVEIFTAEMVQDMCSHCRQQSVSGHCRQRSDRTCPLFLYVRPIVEVIAAYLGRKGDEDYLRSHPPRQREEPSTEEPRMIHRIMIAVNDSRSASHAVAVGGDLATALQAQVRLVHAVFPLLLVDVDMPELVPRSEALITAAEALLADWRGALPASLAVDTQVVQGRPADAIVDAARQWNADLIVVGDHRPHSLAAFLLGSTADAVVRHAACPVLVARPTRWPAAQAAEAPAGVGVAGAAKNRE